jgi:hypothetical protein
MWRSINRSEINRKRNAHTERSIMREIAEWPPDMLRRNIETGAHDA